MISLFKIKGPILRILCVCVITYYTPSIIAQVPWPGINVFNNPNGINSGSEIYSNPTSVGAPYGAGTFSVSGTAHVDFKAGQYIALKPGFSAGPFTGNGSFHAYIAQNDFDVVIINPENNNSPEVVGKFEKFEMGIKLPQDVTNQINDYLLNPNTGINPYDQNSISIEATFTAPGGATKVVYGFYYIDYVEDLNSTSTDPGGKWDDQYTPYPWRIRFAPTEVGMWSCSINVNIPGSSTLNANSLNFLCQSSGNKGYLQVGQYKRQLRFSGTQESFFAIGQNVAWTEWTSDSQGRWFDGKPMNYAIQKAYINDIHAKGGNYTRVVLAPWSSAVEWEKMGDYNDRQPHLWELDKIFEQAHTDNLFVHLCLEMHSQYQTVNADDTIPDDTIHDWNHNPYKTGNQNVIQGINNPIDFFTNTTAQDYFKRRLRYIVARWGYSTNLSAYELFSEVDNVDNYSIFANRINITQWHGIMADYIKQTLGENNHLVTTSYAGDPGPYTVSAYGGPSLDITSRHRYGGYNPDPIMDVKAKINYVRYHTLVSEFVDNNSYVGLDYYDKPYIMEEMGDDHYKSLRDNCNDWDFHNALWATAFMNGYGAGLDWWHWKENSIRENFTALNSFISGHDFENNQYQPQRFTDVPDNVNTGRGIESYSLINNNLNEVLGWVHNFSYYFGITAPCGSDSPLAVNSSEKLEIQGLKVWYNNHRARYHIDWYSVPHAGPVSSPYSSEAKKTTLSGKLKPDVWDMFQVAGEYAYKMYLQGSKSLDNDDTFETDTIACPDTLAFNGVYEDDYKGTRYNYLWNLGNGITSVLAHPKTYYQPGAYTATLIVSDTSGLSDTLIQPILVLACDTNQTRALVIHSNSAASATKNKDKINVFPNPNNGTFIIQTDQEEAADLSIYDMLGRVVFTTHILSGTQENVVNFTEKQKGIYFIRLVTINNKNIVSKIIIN